jgi:two-component system KDP operon response regulator KdpE
VTKVLVVDDERQIARALRTSLTANGYDVETAGTAEDALELAATWSPDSLILDLGLPDLDGIEVIRRIRGWSDVSIIVLSVRDQRSDKIRALDAGADDYVNKPFAMEELLARMRATLRRAHPQPEPSPVLHFGDLEVDLQRTQARLNGEPLRLTPTEWALLEGLRHEPRQAPHAPVDAPARLGAGVHARPEPLPPDLRPSAPAQDRRTTSRTRATSRRSEGWDTGGSTSRDTRRRRLSTPITLGRHART